MIVLGLGSNMGDRLANLQEAYTAIKTIPDVSITQVSPIYISDALLPQNAPADWHKPYLNLALRCVTSLQPKSLLMHLKKIENSMGRKGQTKRWGPRIIDIDILTFGNLTIKNETLTIPHTHLHERPFALWPLADVAPLWVFPAPLPHQGKTAAEVSEQWGSRHTGHAPLRTKQINQRIDTPQLVGILNITPDSFSDGGQFNNPVHAVAHMQTLVEMGASVIDIGAESTAPNAELLDAKAEWQRLEPILLALKALQPNFSLWPRISVDTRHAETASKALRLGVDWINDVTGLQDPAMRAIVAETKADCVVMHHLSIPANPRHIIAREQDPLPLIYEWAAMRLDKLEQSGIAREKMIFDPGIGFGKSREHALLLIKNIAMFSKLNTRLLLGHSRKSFMSLFTEKPAQERDVETMAIAQRLMDEPVNYLRVHQVAMCARGFKVARAI